MLQCESIEHAHAATQHILQSIYDDILRQLMQGARCLVAAPHATPMRCNMLGMTEPTTTDQ